MRHLISSFFSRAFLALLACGALAVHAAPDFQATALSEHILLVSGPAGNTLVAEDRDGLVLVDGVPAEQAEAYLAFIREQTGRRDIKALVNSHWHHERIGLNDILGQREVAIIAHDNTRQWLATTIRRRGDEILHRPLPDHALPDQRLFALNGQHDLPFRDGRIELGHLLKAHTDGDLYVYFPEQNILYAGDVLRSDGWSVVDEATNGYIGGLMEAFDRLAMLIDENTVIVPGSGPVMTQRDFLAQHEMYKGLMAEMVTLLKSAKSVREVLAANPAAGLRPEWGDPAPFLDEGMRSFYGNLRDARHLGAIP